MTRTTFGALVGGMSLLIALGVIMNAQRATPDTTDTDAALRQAIDGCGRGTGRWGGRITETRNNATGQVMIRAIMLDHEPDVGESEAVLQAWFACRRMVNDDAHETVYDNGKGGRYYRTGSGTGYSIHKGRIECISIADQFRCTPRGTHA